MRDDREKLDPMDDEMPDALIGSVARELRRPVRMDPALDARVMAAVLGASSGADGREPAAADVRPLVLAHPVRRGPWRWLLEPKTVRVSPLLGLAMAAAFAGIMVLGTRRDDPMRTELAGGRQQPVQSVFPVSDTPREARTTQQRYVHFVFVSPDAKRVSVVGDFNDWNVNETPLAPARNQRGVWSVSVPLPPGRYTYTFVVDGETWVADPSAPPALEDDFGTPKSVVTVGGSHT